ncbi:MAG: hypothetical protein Q9167_002961 [Letrouitia subvulpina]
MSGGVISRLALSPVLLPGLDILNHDPNAKIRWQWTEKDCQIVTEANLQGRLQIYNNYATKSNAERKRAQAAPLINGYGFSLFRNQADHCTLSLGPAATSRIATYIERVRGGGAKSLRCQDSILVPNEENFSFGSSTTAFCDLDTPIDPGQQGAAPSLGFVRLAGILYQQQNGLKFPYTFSPGFLEDASIAFSNQREFRQDDIGRAFEIDSLETCLTRLKLHVICAVVMILQRQQALIIQYNSRLPPWPENDRQFHAARYRRSQLRILEITTSSIIRRVRRLSGLETSCLRDVRLVRLEHILEESPKQLATDFRAILHAGFGTRNPERIRSSLLVESTFALWLCGLWLLSTGTVGFRPLFATESAFGLKISQWLLFLRRAYDHSFETVAESILAKLEEDVPLAESCYAVIKAGVKKKPASIYNRPEVTHERLLWCLDIIREESFMTPDLDGKFGEEHDGFMLFMECGTE